MRVAVWGAADELPHSGGNGGGGGVTCVEVEQLHVDTCQWTVSSGDAETVLAEVPSDVASTCLAVLRRQARGGDPKPPDDAPAESLQPRGSLGGGSGDSGHGGGGNGGGSGDVEAPQPDVGAGVGLRAGFGADPAVSVPRLALDTPIGRGTAAPAGGVGGVGLSGGDRDDDVISGVVGDVTGLDSGGPVGDAEVMVEVVATGGRVDDLLCCRGR